MNLSSAELNPFCVLGTSRDERQGVEMASEKSIDLTTVLGVISLFCVSFWLVPAFVGI